MTVGTGARRYGVTAGQRKSHRVVIKLCVQPIVRRVALFARSGESRCRQVVGRRGHRCRGLVIRLMAGVALRRHRLELAVRRVLMAGIAIDGCMRAGEREAIVVLLNFFDRYSPAANGMTLLAIRTELAFVNVGVAILAALADVAENRFDMALGASHIAVHAAQRITGLIVIEFRDSANRLPAFGGVTVLARDVQVAVRATGAGSTLR